MALSQIQCLDDHHVNWRVSESKPEFFYSEDQRIAVETLISQGRDAFKDYILKSGLREFLSETELEKIAQKAEPYRPGHEHTQRHESAGPGNITPGSGEDLGDGEVSLQYWPDRSEASVAELDLGWPESISYRGVTRVTVHTQPPVEGHTHIKEVVRKSIAAAQKVRGCQDDGATDDDDEEEEDIVIITVEGMENMLFSHCKQQRKPKLIITNALKIKEKTTYMVQSGQTVQTRLHLKSL